MRLRGLAFGCLVIISAVFQLILLIRGVSNKVLDAPTLNNPSSSVRKKHVLLDPTNTDRLLQEQRHLPDAGLNGYYKEPRKETNALPQSRPLLSTPSTSVVEDPDKDRNNEGNGGQQHTSPTNKNNDDDNTPNNSEKPSNNATAGKNRFLQIFKEAKIKVDDESLQQLPTWSQVEALYGKGGPKILGLETCQAFRDSVPTESRLLGGAGLWNTGTNALREALIQNCKIFGPNQTVEFQVPWGKHMPASVRETGHSAPQQAWIQLKNILPIVIVKDPLTWMQSMCKNPYRVSWFHTNNIHCPNLVPFTENEWKKSKNYTSTNDNPNLTHSMTVTVKYPPPLYRTPLTWPSLAHLWSEWNRDYYQVSHYPRLMIRYEDLLFRAPETIRQICDCAGGQIRPKHGGKHAYHTESAKTQAGGHSSSTNLLSALIKYGNAQNRKKGMTPEDLAFAMEALDPELMGLFQYSL